MGRATSAIMRAVSSIGREESVFSQRVVRSGVVFRRKVMRKIVPRCPACHSERVSGGAYTLFTRSWVSPVVSGPFILAGMVVGVFDGIGKLADGHSRVEGGIEVAICAAVFLFVAASILRGTHRCRNCQRNFNWPPLRMPRFEVVCPKCREPVQGLTDDCIGEKAACRKCGEVFEIVDPFAAGNTDTRY